MDIESMSAGKPKMIDKEKERSNSYDIDKFSTHSDDEQYQDTEDIQLINTTQPLNVSKYIRLCLYAVVKPVEVEVYPTVVHFKPIEVNKSTTSSLTLLNRSASLPIIFKYKKIAFINAVPNEGVLECEEMMAIAVRFTPQAAGSNNKCIQFDLFYRNQPETENAALVKVGHVAVDIVAHVRPCLVIGIPKFICGITPEVTNEVGFLTDNIKFNADVKKPRQAMLKCDTNARKVRDAIIAFPNDRPQSLRPYMRTDVKCKTIFAAMNRIVVTSDEYMLTSAALREKLKNDKIYLDYIDNLAEYRRINITCKISHELDDYPFTKLLETVPHCNYLAARTRTKSIRYTYSSLTPTQLFLIDVKPHIIKSDKIIVGSFTKYKVTIDNSNSFPVKVILKTHDFGDDSVFPNLPQHFVIKPAECRMLQVHFKPVEVGKFNAILNICVNELHFVPILFLVDVVLPCIKLDRHEIIFDDANPEPFQYVNLHNLLNTNVTYFWSIPTSCCFSVQPLSGVIPPNRFISTEIAYNVDFLQRASAKLMVRSVLGSTSYLNVTAFVEKCNIILLASQVQFPHIPLNIRTYQINTLRNFSQFTILYTVKNPNPCPGVQVTPTGGKIRGRSDLDFKIAVYFKAIVKFDCKVDIEFQHHPEMSFQITGEVDMPNLVFRTYDMKPTKKKTRCTNVKRVPAGSLDILPFTIYNKGKSFACLRFVKELFPEITIAKSMEIKHLFKATKCNECIELDSGEKTLLYIHFFPLDVSMYEFYLPFVINDILGPCNIDNPSSLLPYSYLSQHLPMYKDPHIEIVQQEKAISTFPVSTLSTRHAIRFSKTLFKFKYFPNPNYRSITSQEIRIRNTSKDTTEFCIGIDDLLPYFDLKCKSDIDYKVQNNFMIFSVEAENELTLVVHFLPSVPGTFAAYLPIHIRDLKDATVFNYLQLAGKYPIAVFTAPKWVYLNPVPLGFVLSFDIHLKAEFHSNDCMVELEHDVHQLKAMIISSSVADDNEQLCWEMTIRLRFYSLTPISFETKMQITCKCGGYCEVNVTGCANNSVLLKYMYRCPDVVYMENTNIITYPDFPDKNTSCIEFITYMDRIVKICERWMYEQVFYSTYYKFIPESFSGAYRDITSKTLPQPGDVKTMVIVKILKNIVGEKVLPFLINRDIPEIEMDRINYYHATFRNAIVFLKAQGAQIPHVFARHLLCYKDYVIYVHKIRIQKQKPQLDIASEHNHFLRHKQCWLDLIIQIFYCMFLSTVIERNRTDNLVCGIEFDESLLTNKSGEEFLLLWLNTIFECGRVALTNLDTKRPSDFVLEPRTISNFTIDLADGLVFATVTLHFCPYLAYHLKNIYVCVDTPDKVFHNAVQLILAWKLIKCSFTLRPHEIANPVGIHMLMLLVYMCDVFPSLVPIDNITFDVPLSTTMSKEIDVRNVNKYSDLFYTVQYLNNEMDSFSIANQDKTIKITAGRLRRLKLFYQAKKITPVKAVLIFCGETPEHSYGKYIVFYLTGTANFSETARNLIVLSVNLYTHESRRLKVYAPYSEAAVYDVVYSFDKIEDINTANIATWKESIDVIRPRMVRCSETKLVCNENGIAFISLELYCMSSKEVSRWVIYTNKEVGDFFLHFLMRPTRIDQLSQTPLYVNVPDNWDDIRCECKRNSLIAPDRCPRTILLHVPSRNDLFWSIIIKSVLFGAPEDERPIWSKYLECETGLHIIKWLVSDRLDNFFDIFNLNTKYKVVNPNVDIDLPPCLYIRNIRSMDNVELKMHVRDDGVQTNNYSFSLQSIDGAEVRQYKVILEKFKYNDG